MGGGRLGEEGTDLDGPVVDSAPVLATPMALAPVHVGAPVELDFQLADLHLLFQDQVNLPCETTWLWAGWIEGGRTHRSRHPRFDSRASRP